MTMGRPASRTRFSNPARFCGQERHFAQSAPEEGNRYALRRYTAEVRRLLDVLDRRLAENEYLAGDSFTVADVAAFPGVQLHTDLMGGRWGRPNMVRWLDRIDRRAGYRKVKPAVLDLQARDAEAFAKAGPGTTGTSIHPRLSLPAGTTCSLRLLSGIFQG